MSAIKLRCDACGFVSRRRKLENLNKPCPKCGGSMSFESKEDQQQVQILAILTLVAFVVIWALFTAAGVGQ